VSDSINQAAAAGQLEEFAARTEADGDAMPSEMREMIARLREIVRALDGLTSSMGGE
jgi:hypothetical protein